MNILETIIADKRREVELRKLRTPVQQLYKMPGFQRQTFSLGASLLAEDSTGIIAEFKRRSPSKGTINNSHSVSEIAGAYKQHGAAGISILTDEKYFGGKDEDLLEARVLDLPMLRKDFVVDEYQLMEAKALGADVILLIAACLPVEQVANLSRLARALQLEVLLELHDEAELDHYNENVNLVGINNRDLKTFTVDIERSIRLAEKLGDVVKVAESGITSAQTVLSLKQSGFHGFLIGEYFMSKPDPAVAFAEFVNQLKAMECR